MRDHDEPEPRKRDRAHRRQVRAALLRKEWREQRWRFFLGTVVLTGMLAGMLRAQIIPPSEAALLVYWPVGVLMVIFLAMGPVASERADRTWEFLIAQPISRADVLLAKWKMGLIQLVGMMAIATVCGLLAMWSRGFRGQTTLLEETGWRGTSQDIIAWASDHPAGWVCVLAVAATAALACWYTPLFFLLTRARNEFAAALGGILLTIALHAWLGQFTDFDDLFVVTATLNPLAPLVAAMHPDYMVWVPLVAPVHVLLWIVLPLWLVRRIARRAATK